jgi:hypothetical protein
MRFHIVEKERKGQRGRSSERKDLEEEINNS